MFSASMNERGLRSRQFEQYIPHCFVQGCQMVYFKTKNHNLGVFLEGLGMESVGIYYALLVYCTAIWYTYLGSFCIFVVIWYIFPVLLCFTQKNLATLVYFIFESLLWHKMLRYVKTENVHSI
jgi:hypothetical protein